MTITMRGSGLHGTATPRPALPGPLVRPKAETGSRTGRALGHPHEVSPEGAMTPSLC